jgi:hypothetical protein
MVFDTLLAVDEDLRIQPRTVDSWKVSDDKLTRLPSVGQGHDGLLQAVVLVEQL